MRNSIMSQRERVTHIVKQSHYDLLEKWLELRRFRLPNRSGTIVSYKCILVHEFTRTHKFANYLSVHLVCSSLVRPLLV